MGIQAFGNLTGIRSDRRVVTQNSHGLSLNANGFLPAYRDDTGAIEAAAITASRNKAPTLWVTKILDGDRLQVAEGATLLKVPGHGLNLGLYYLSAIEGEVTQSTSDPPSAPILQVSSANEILLFDVRSQLTSVSKPLYPEETPLFYLGDDQSNPNPLGIKGLTPDYRANTIADWDVLINFLQGFDFAGADLEFDLDGTATIDARTLDGAIFNSPNLTFKGQSPTASFLERFPNAKNWSNILACNLKFTNYNNLASFIDVDSISFGSVSEPIIFEDGFPNFTLTNCAGLNFQSTTVLPQIQNPQLGSIGNDLFTINSNTNQKFQTFIYGLPTIADSIIPSVTSKTYIKASDVTILGALQSPISFGGKGFDLTRTHVLGERFIQGAIFDTADGASILRDRFNLSEIYADLISNADANKYQIAIAPANTIPRLYYSYNGLWRQLTGSELR